MRVGKDELADITALGLTASLDELLKTPYFLRRATFTRTVGPPLAARSRRSVKPPGSTIVKPPSDTQEGGMALHARVAAQYIRMSTDKQDLSPMVQKEAIAAYAASNGLEIIASYEDEGRSGVYLTNRPGLSKLLQDVTSSPPYSVVLVYDISRWGRFQDADASAYYDYHCRLHDVQVIYVAEAFGSELTPMGTLAKNMKRVMAAEYSRELASKSRAGQHRVVNMGFQMEQLPALGYRRCSVSANRERKVILEPGQRKLTLTDRIEWILGPDNELAVIRRLCNEYARGQLGFTDLARLSVAEGWTDRRGRRLTAPAIATLVRNEALIGNFVWGQHSHQQRILDKQLCRATGTVPRIIDDLTWHQVQERLAREATVKNNDVLREELRRALTRTPMLVSRELVGVGCAHSRTYSNRFGNWAAAVRQAGGDPSALSAAVAQRARERKHHIRVFGRALADALRAQRLTAAYDGRRNLLCLWGVTIQLRLLWKTGQGEADHQWHIRDEAVGPGVAWVLLVRMREPFQALDFFVVTSSELATRFPPWLALQVAPELQRFRYGSPSALIKKLRTMSAPLHVRTASLPAPVD